MSAESRKVTGLVSSAATSAPVPGASVTLTRWLQAASSAHELEERKFHTVSRADGHYELEVELPDETARAGEQWFAEVSAPGFSFFDRLLAPLSQQAGALNFELTPGFALRGTVRDVLGQPIAGARLALMQSSSFSCRAVRTHACSKETDATGAFEVEGLPLSDGAEQQVVLALYHAHFERHFVHRLERLPRREGTASVEVTLRRGRSVSGVVRDVSGAPVAGAELCVTAERFYACDPGCAGPAVQCLETGADGRFEAHGLPRHRFWVTARLGDRLGATPVSLLEGSLTAVEVQLDEGQSLTGRVLSADHRPVVGVEVSGRQYLAGLERTTRTDARGWYRLDGFFPGLEVLVTAGAADERTFAPPRDDADVRLRPLVRVFGRVVDREGKPRAAAGEVRLTLFDPGFRLGPEAPVASDGCFHFEQVEETESFLHIDPADRALVASFVPVTVGPTDTDLGDVVLDEGACFHGRVLDPRGAPVRDAEVHLESPRYLEGFATGSDHDGRFRVERLTRGRFQLKVSAPGFATHHDGALTIERDTERTVQLARGGSIAGRVLDGAQPIAGQSLALHRPAEPRVVPSDRGVRAERRLRIDDTTTDADGCFRFAAVSAGRWAIRCGLEEREVEVTEGCETRCDFAWPGEGDGFATP